MMRHVEDQTGAVQGQNRQMTDFLKPLALALVTFFPNSGCTTHNSRSDLASQSARSSEFVPESSNLQVSTLLYGEKGYPTPYDGTCSSLEYNTLMAAITSLVAARPYAVQEMITPTRSGEDYDVRIKGTAIDVNVILRSPTHEQLSSPIKCGPNGYWPAVLANAGETLPKQSLISSMAALSGLEVKRVPLSSLSSDQLQQMLLEANADHRAVCFRTIAAGSLEKNRLVGSIIFQPDKAYSVIEVDPQSGTVTILDPSRDMNLDDLTTGSFNGVASIPISKLEEYFRYLYIESGKPKQPKESGARSI